MVSIEMKSIPPLEMGNETYQYIKGFLNNQENLGLKTFQKHA
jgi:hypothetical protein